MNTQMASPAALPRAKRRFGQHFLVNPAIIGRIAAAIAPRGGDAVVEIGPGPGALTRALLPALDRLDVVELDRDLLAGLETLGAEFPGRLHIHHADALRFDFAALAETLGRPLRVVGNLPYNISTPLLFHLLAHPEALQDMHFMLQKEVVERIAAHPGGKDYGRLSVMVQAYCQAETLFVVKPGAFLPPPKVDSAVIRLIPHRPPWLPAELAADFARVVGAAFAARRKTLANNLKGLMHPDTIAACGVDPGRRAETLDKEDFLCLTRRLADIN